MSTVWIDQEVQTTGGSVRLLLTSETLDIRFRGTGDKEGENLKRVAFEFIEDVRNHLKDISIQYEEGGQVYAMEPPEEIGYIDIEATDPQREGA